MYTKLLVYISFIFVLISGVPAGAEDYTSANFILRDPVITAEGGYASSASFQYFSSSGQTDIGESTSAAFTERAGFLYFPAASTSVISATAGNGQAALTWTAAAGTLGNVTNYRVGTATVSGGPYTYESVGNVLAFTKTGLVNGTTYYFVVQAQAATETAASSAQVSATPAAPVTTSAGGGGGGGGGGAVSPPIAAQVVFSGRAYPKSTVTLLKDAQIAASTIAGADAAFQVSVSDISGGNYIFSVYSEDSKGIRSSLLTFPISVTSGATTNVGGIFIAPTIAVDKSEVKRGDNIAIFGQSAPNAEITIAVNSDEEFFAKTPADQEGVYLYNFDTSPLAMEQHFTRSKSASSGGISSFSKSISFLVGAKNVAKVAREFIKGDLNADGRVNLIDFSIAAYWYKRPAPPAAIDLNGDGKVDLVDFSIMAFYWTG
ncbi:hypothetical protein HYW17_05940 [Candidatus Uhrbacteria bacterium]|nr:hypothetical protein [Candidatus Uhrbacteria bacterium]